jgi:hypothetical protein
MFAGPDQIDVLQMEFLGADSESIVEVCKAFQR